MIPVKIAANIAVPMSATPALPSEVRAAVNVAMALIPGKVRLPPTHSAHVAYSAGCARTGMSASSAYIATDAAMAARSIHQSLFTGKRNSPETCDTASKPTNAHGIMAKMRSTCAKLPEPFGENAGAIDARPPSWCARMAKKHAATQTSMNAARMAWMRPARRLPQRQARPATTIMPTEKSTSPR